MPPKVSHVRGTELVVEHIEKYWCPTVTSNGLVGGPAFRFSEDKRLCVAILVATTPPAGPTRLCFQFGQMLREKHGCHVTVLHGQGTSNIPATDELKNADCLYVLLIRRLAAAQRARGDPPRYLDAGRPLVALHSEPRVRRPRRGRSRAKRSGRVRRRRAGWELPRSHRKRSGQRYFRPRRGERAHPIWRASSRAGSCSGSLYKVSPLKDLRPTMSQPRSARWAMWSSRSRGPAGATAAAWFYLVAGHPGRLQATTVSEVLVNARAPPGDEADPVGFRTWPGQQQSGAGL